MRHPIWKGLALAVLLTLLLAVEAPQYPMAAMPGRRDRAMDAMLPVGALLASLPERFRARGKEKRRVSWQRCLLAFAAGAAAMGGAMLCRGALITVMAGGAMTGTWGGLACLTVTLPVSAACAVLLERRRGA